MAPDKTKVCHIDEGFDFLGFRIQRLKQRGSARRLIYTFPSKKAMQTIGREVKAVTTLKSQGTDAGDRYRRLGQITRGWTLYFRHLGHHVWRRVWIWWCQRCPKTPRRQLYRMIQPPGTWWPPPVT